MLTDRFFDVTLQQDLARGTTKLVHSTVQVDTDDDGAHSIGTASDRAGRQAREALTRSTGLDWEVMGVTHLDPATEDRVVDELWWRGYCYEYMTAVTAALDAAPDLDGPGPAEQQDHMSRLYKET